MEDPKVRPYYFTTHFFVPAENHSGHKSKRHPNRKNRDKQEQAVLRHKEKADVKKSVRKQRPTVKRNRSVGKKRNRFGGERMSSLYNELHLLDS